MKSNDRRLARQRLDERLSALHPAERLRPPPRGWIRAVRQALGMSGVQFAARLGVRPQTVTALESSEASGVIQLDTLRRAAEALDCTLVYALVPNTTFEDAIGRRARRRAMRDLQRVAHTMKLEAQAVDGADSDARIADHIRDSVDDRDLWNDT